MDSGKRRERKRREGRRREGKGRNEERRGGKEGGERRGGKRREKEGPTDLGSDSSMSWRYEDNSKDWRN